MTAPRMYRVEIPSKPIAKGRARFGKNGAVPFTPKQTVVAEAWVRLKVTEAVGTPRLEGPVRVTVDFVMPIPRSWSRQKQSDAAAGRLMPTGKPDWDNLAKLTSDALNGIAWADDASVVQATVRKRYGPVPMTVVEWGPAEAPCAHQDEAVAGLGAELL